MRRLIVMATAVLLIVGMFCGCMSEKSDVLVEETVSVDADSDWTIRFIDLGEKPSQLCYDNTTYIVYLKQSVDSTRYIYTAYYAQNGLPYRYNPETQSLEEITIKVTEEEL